MPTEQHLLVLQLATDPVDELPASRLCLMWLRLYVQGKAMHQVNDKYLNTGGKPLLAPAGGKPPRRRMGEILSFSASCRISGG